MRARLTLVLPRVGFAALLAVCAVVPVVFTRRTAEAFLVPKATLLWLCYLAMALGIASWTLSTRERPLPRPQVLLPLGALVAWTTIATIWSTSPAVSALGQYGRYDGWLSTVAGAGAALAVAAFVWRSPERLRHVAGAILVGAGAGLAYVLVQQAGLDWVDWVDESRRPIARPYGALGNSNFSGAHLALAIPIALLAGLRRPRGAARWALLAFSALLVLGVWWTGTRGGMLAAAGGVAVAGLLAPDLVPRAIRWPAAAAGALALVAVLGVTATDSLPGQERMDVPRYLGTETLLERRELWAAGLSMAADHPIVGVGPDAFGLRFADHRPPGTVDRTPLNADEAHSIWIDRLATAGVPALAAYVWLVLAIGAATWRARRTVAPEHRWLLGAFGGAFAGYLVQGAFSIDIAPLAALGWVFVGALIALGDPRVVAARAADPAATRTVAGRAIGAPALTVLLVGALALATSAVRPLIADVHQRQGLEAIAAGEPGAVAAARFRAASTWHRSEPRYHVRLASHLVDMATREVVDDDVEGRLLREAVTGYDQALRWAPGDALIERARARTLVVLGTSVGGQDDLVAAVTAYRGLLDRIDTDPSLLVELGQVHESLAARAARRADDLAASSHRAEAIEAFDAALALDEESTEALSGLARLAVAEGRDDDARRYLDRAWTIAPGDPGIARALDQLDGPDGAGG